MRTRHVLALVLAATIAAGCGRSGAEGSHEGARSTPVGDDTSARSPGDESPTWYGRRTALRSCGIDAEYTDDYPNMAGRECFRSAYASNAAAELTRVTYGDEGESIRAHFRVLGPGAYEIVAEQIGNPSPQMVGDGRWERYACDRFVFMDEPGAEASGAPWVNAEGECELVDQQPRRALGAGR